MREDHLTAVTALETVCFASPWTREGLAEELRNPQAHFLVAEADGVAVGYIGVQRCRRISSCVPQIWTGHC